MAAVDLADVVDWYYVGMIEACGGAGFAPESFVEIGVFGLVGQQRLDRHHAVDGGVVGAPYLAHAAAAQQLNQLVAAEWRPVHRRTITGRIWSYCGQSAIRRPRLWLAVRGRQQSALPAPSPDEGTDASCYPAIPSIVR